MLNTVLEISDKIAHLQALGKQTACSVMNSVMKHGGIMRVLAHEVDFSPAWFCTRQKVINLLQCC